MTRRYSDAEYLNSDQGRIREIATPAPRERYRLALAERSFAEQQVWRLQHQLDPMTHSGSGDAIDRLRQVQMVRELLPGACQRLADAIERCTVLRPAPQPRPRREPKPVVWLNQAPTRSRTTQDYRDMSMTQLTKNWSVSDWQDFARSKDRYEQRNLGYLTRDLRNG